MKESGLDGGVDLFDLPDQEAMTTFPPPPLQQSCT